MITAGTDVGNKFTKTVIVENKKILSYGIVCSGFDQKKAAEDSCNQALLEAGISKNDIGYIVATGAGQSEVAFAENYITDISSAAKGAVNILPQARTISDLGAEEARVIKVNEIKRS